MEGAHGPLRAWVSAHSPRCTIFIVGKGPKHTHR
jgi:hypothetical protein